MAQTAYSVVVATRNRPDALALSLPLFLAQTRPPQAVIVVDSSDDPGPVAALVARFAARTAVPLTLIASAPGANLQRNLGLARVDTEVVICPDDDSIVAPETFERMMRIYDLDAGGVVGGVCAAEAREPPEAARGAIRAGYRMTRVERVKARVARIRHAVEDRLIRDPFLALADRNYARLPQLPPPIAAANAILVPWMTGFRMSFRTASLRRHGFNENLGRYALFDDVDAGFAVMGTQLLVAALDAEIYHHKAPGQRASGRALGVMHILNRAYVLVNRGEVDRRIARLLRRYCRYKILLYRLGARSDFGRDRLAGARAAFRRLPEMLAAPPDRRTEVYLQLRAACLEGAAL